MVKFSPILENSSPNEFFFFEKIKRKESMSKNDVLEKNPSFLAIICHIP